MVGLMNEKNNNRITVRTTFMERSFSHESISKKEVPRFDSCVTIKVISYRHFKHDTDGISAKYIIDAIVAIGILQDDSCAEVKKISYESRLCKKGQEKTIIEIAG